MTDLEISKALALAIGWTPGRMFVVEGKLRIPRNEKQWSWQVFDYRDWNIAGPIAEKYNCFPTKLEALELWGSNIGNKRAEFGYTPQSAIALAVIGAKK
jgi:hypothetical protein